jgi:hypothetical protein
MDGRKLRFIIKLAEFLVDNQGGKSIALSIQSDAAPVKWASEWAALRSETPLRGYPTVEEAVEQLKEFLG